MARPVLHPPDTRVSAPRLSPWSGAVAREAAAPKGGVLLLPAATLNPPIGRNERRLRGRLIFSVAGRVILLRVRDIDWIDAEGDYVRIHVGKICHRIRARMRDLEARLEAELFVRIHRSTIVNLERVTELRPCYRGEYLVMLQDGIGLKLSRGYRPRLATAIGHKI